MLLASTTALAACGGGGGGGGGPTVEFSPTKESIGQLGIVTAEGAVVSALVEMTKDNHFGVQEIVKAFQFVEKYPDLDTSKLLNYTIKIDGVEQSLANAWNELKGYKALFYDDRKTWWQDLAQNGKLDTENQNLSEITTLNLAITKEQRRKIGSGELDKDTLLVDIGYKATETGRTTDERVHTTSSDEVDTTTSYAQSTSIVDGYTVYYNTPTTTTTTVTTTVTTKTPIVTITWSDGSTTTETADSTTTTVVGDPVVITTVGDAQEIYREKTENVSITSTTDDGGVAQEAAVTTTHADVTTSVIDENGNETFTTVRTYTDTTTIDTITTTTTIVTVTPTTTRIENGVTTVTEAVSTVTTSQSRETTTETTTATRSEIVHTWTVEAEVVETGRTTENVVTTSDAVSTADTPVTVTTYVDLEDSGVVQANGDTLYTTTRTYTDTTTTTTVTTTVTTTNTTPVTTITYSNDTTETITGETVVTTSTATTSNDVVTTATRTEVVDTRTVSASSVTITGTDVSYGGKVWSHVVKTHGTPVVTTEDVTTYEGTWKVVTRTVTTTTPEFHEHFDDQEKTTVTTYSDGTTKTETETVQTSRGVVEKLPLVETVVTELSRVNTDNGEIGEDHADMGTRTPGYNSNPTHYQTDEYNYIANKFHSTSNFSTAYSRGWTGKGSLVVVADTGALTTHSDLDGNIAYTKDYTNSTMADGASHGTHVAGIVAAEKNDVGMHGAAFDAKLAIAKVSSGNSFSFSRAKQAASWGAGLGSVAINLSGEVNHDTAFRNSIVDQGNGNYYSTHWYYGTNGYNGAGADAPSWKAALGDEQVLVKAAGNAGKAYSAGMNQMATATDDDGNLILDGQMIIVGNWDSQNGVINSSSNKAGTVCTNFANGVCLDAAKIKDFYIMADGTNVTSTSVNGGYVSMTGTSMAAPVVTGSIAVLHQMWPFMKGKSLVQLVLVTGNKNIAGYDENVHGQGLLDMDKATRPVGATGIPTSGRTDGGVSAVTGGANVSGVSAGQITALTGVMVLDSFERDFYIDLGDMTQSVDTRTASVAEQMGAVNYFAPYLDKTQSVAVPVTINERSSVTVGAGATEGSYLGNSFSGTLGTTKSSSTVYANYNYVNGGFYAQAGLGITSVEFDKSNSMLASADRVISSTATAGYNINDNWGFAVSQPVTIESAKMDYNVPVARTLDGNVVTEMRTVDFKSSSREIDLGTYYNFNLGPAKVNTFAEVRTGVAALKNAIEGRMGLNLKMEF